MKALLVGVVVVVLVLLLVGGSYVSSKNQMVAKDAAVKASWSDIDTTLQRRADLIPNLVATVKGYATHEEKVFADIANARAGLLVTVAMARGIVQPASLCSMNAPCKRLAGT